MCSTHAIEHLEAADETLDNKEACGRGSNSKWHRQRQDVQDTESLKWCVGNKKKKKDGGVVSCPT